MKEERVEFGVIRSDFNIYEVENGQTLKVKVDLLDVINTTENENQSKGKVQTQIYSHVITPSSMDASGLELAIGNLTDKDNVKELNFKKIKDVINIYETKKAFILTGLNVVKIFLTNKKNQNNEPILRFTSNSGIDLIQKPEFDVSSTN